MWNFLCRKYSVSSRRIDCRSKAIEAAFVMLIVAAVFAVSTPPAEAQVFQEFYLVDSPTAGILPHGGYMFYGGVGPSNSLLAGTMIGFYDRLMLGVSFGLQKFVGRGPIDLNEKPGFQVRFRLLEEDTGRPALTVGLDTQGEDAYVDSHQRYERKSKGFFAVLSKNYKLISDFSIHAGINYSLERRDESGMNIFGGMAVELFRGFSLIADYNAALDDNDSSVPTCRTRGRGYLDTGIRFDYMDNLRIKLLFKDLLGNYIPEDGVARSIEIFYFNYF